MSKDIKKLFKENNVKGIACDSRKVREGFAFFAIDGVRLKGSDFIEDALQNGASIIITNDKTKENTPLVVYSDDIRRDISIAASIIYPNLPNNIVAVTGTNGKTSTVSYFRQLFAGLELSSASLGTIGVECSSLKLQNELFLDEIYSSTTTLDPINLHGAMNALAINGVDYVAMEASSHGLDQKRMHSIKVKAAAFTSFGHDHLDYHKNMREYLDAKLILFEDNLIDGGLAIINSDIENLDYIIKRLESSSINYITIGSSGNVVINIVESSLKGQQIEFTYKNKKYRFFTEILGGFQASNIIIAALLVESCGFDFEKIVNLLPRLIPVQGRLQRITAPSYSFQVFVDYAHTPDSLDKSLKELEALKKPNSKLFVVFGCGGNRDKTKRPEMGKIAKEIADIVIVTDDNPRFEDPAIIRKEIIAEVPEAIEIGDRAKAINHAIKSMQEGDILLIAGKGHEDYQLVAGQKIDFSDAETAFGALK